MRSYYCNKKKIRCKRSLLKLIDIEDNKNCWFQCLYSHSIFYKNPIQLMNNPFIVDRLIATDAALIGVVCGEIYKEYLKQCKILHPPYFSDVNHDDSFYRLLLVSREGLIEYETNHSERFLEKNILNFAQNKELIKMFSPADAYYIGFLAGLELYKIKNNLKIKKTAHRAPNLKLIFSRSK